MDLGKDPALVVPCRGHLESGGIPRGAWIPGPWARPVAGGWGFQAVQGQVESLRAAGVEGQRVLR